MGQKTIRFSDLSEKLITDDGDLVRIVVREHPELHAFASVPLATHDGHAIGTLCVFDVRPRTFTDEELEDLQLLAAVAMRELDLRLASRRALFRA